MKVTEVPDKPLSKAGQLAKAVRERLGLEKATRSGTSTYTSTSESAWTETADEPAVDPAAGGAVEMAAATSATTTNTEKAEAVDLGEVLTGVLEPITKAVTGLASRLEKLEDRPVGSRVIKASMPGATITDNGGQGEKFGEFTKFLSRNAGLSAGQRLSKATISAAGWTYGLSFAESGSFIDYIIDQSVLLKQIRTIKMRDKKQPIDKVGLGGKVLVKGTAGTDPGDTVSISGPTQVMLDASEMLAIVSIGDDTLEDNIEGEAFVQHLLGMIARAASNELEQAAMHGDTAVADTGILDRFDGWYKIAKAGGAHVVEAMTDTDRYWPGTNAAKATKLIKVIPSKYRQDLRNLGCLLNPDCYLDYNDELATKGYSNAFASITGIQDVPVRGIRNIQVPMLKTDMSFTYSATPYTDGTVVMITDLRNLIWGIHREIKIEPFRQPRKRCTDYVLSLRAAVQVENCDAIAIYDHAKVK